VSEQTIDTWRKRLGELRTEDVGRLRQLEAESGRLKKLVAERDLEIDMMREVAAKTGERSGSSPARGVWAGARSLGTAGLHAVFGGGPVGCGGRVACRCRAGGAADAWRHRGCARKRRQGRTGCGAMTSCSTAAPTASS
jgi:hypothetical protein